MTLPKRRSARLAAAVLAVALASAVGCQEADHSQVTVADFPVRTKGSPLELWEYLGGLEQKFSSAQANSPSDARDILMAFTTAAIGTTDAIIADPKTDAPLREQAVKLQFAAYDRRRAIDPNAEKDLLAATDRIEAAHRKTRVESLACEKRTEILGQRASMAGDEDRYQKYKVLVEAVLHTAALDPPPPRAAEVLGNLSNDCEVKRLYDLAKQVEEKLVAMFPDSPEAKFARGALHRHDLKGKVVDDLEGPGKDGKTISIKDYRGKVVVVVFWVTSLAPSVAEVEEVDAFRTKYDPKDLQILGVALEPDFEVASKFLSDKKITWPQIISKMRNIELESDLTLRYGIKALTYKMVIDREGRLVDYGILLSQVRPVLEPLLPPAQEPKRPDDAEAAKPVSSDPPKEK